jgi:hypothetical protein
VTHYCIVEGRSLGHEKQEVKIWLVTFINVLGGHDWQLNDQALIAAKVPSPQIMGEQLAAPYPECIPSSHGKQLVALFCDRGM